MPAEPTTGKGFLVQVLISAVWTTIAGQRGGTLNLSKDTVDVTSKDNNGWVKLISGLRRWSVDFDALVIVDDQGYISLIDAFKNDTILSLRFIRDDGKVFQGSSQLTEFSHDLPFDGAATYSGTLVGGGQPDKFWETP